ncbi:MAG TPA: hypothetical protein VK586_25140, partial [Streptosporangiaceae bacterium]|nr:hypothetical protein [Streptosporangiaceae bacterium]
MASPGGPSENSTQLRSRTACPSWISWAGTTEGQRQAGQRYLADALAVLSVSPGPLAVLDALIALLEPARL